MNSCFIEIAFITPVMEGPMLNVKEPCMNGGGGGSLSNFYSPTDATVPWDWPTCRVQPGVNDYGGT